jgi:N-acetylmuramoyl-L-alanine amidase
MFAFAGVALWSVGLAAAAQEAPLLTILDPDAAVTTTTRGALNVMGRTRPDARVNVAGQPARVFGTGIFVRDQVPLAPGTNRIEVRAEAQGKVATQMLTVDRVLQAEATPSTAPQRLRLDARSVDPRSDVTLAPAEELVVAVTGTPGQQAAFRIGKGEWLPMVEATEADTTAPTGRYSGVFVAPAVEGDRGPLTLEFRLQAQPPRKSPVRVVGPRELRLATKTKVTIWDNKKVRLARTTDEDGTALVYGLHDVRLGGPFVSVLPAGTVLRVIGRRGPNWHVALTPTLDAWVSDADLELLPEGTPPPHLFFTALSVGGDELSDIVSIPYPRTARVPFAVTPTVGPAGRAQICVDFYGAHNAATWISHRPTAKAVREVSLEQPARDHLRVKIDLASEQLWGYLVQSTTGSLQVRVRRAPELAPAPRSPLEGQVIALEAGHGGENTGAGGVSGSKEKDINRMAVDELARQLRAKGARVVEVRPGDTSPRLIDRARHAIESSATLFIAVHANSADQGRGYLRVGGTSTYYKHSFSRDLADAVQTRLLEMTGLDDFGNVGNFNYLPIRENTWMPAILVEQAFMSNPEDEAKMLDPKFRATMMKAVVQGVEDWLARQRDQMKPKSGAKAAPAQVAPPKAAPAKEPPPKATPAKEAPAPATSTKTMPPSAAASQGIPAKEAPAQATPVKAAPAKETQPQPPAEKKP